MVWNFPPCQKGGERPEVLGGGDYHLNALLDGAGVGVGDALFSARLGHFGPEGPVMDEDGGGRGLFARGRALGGLGGGGGGR